MKKISFLIMMLSTVVAQAQQRRDTVSLGPGYARQAWYSFNQGVVQQSPKDNWHLAFSTAGFAVSIHFNTITGGAIFVHPTATAADYEQVDTLGLHSWTPLYNSEITWSIGALNQAANSANQFDVGWGIYSMITHTVNGNRIFFVRLPDGTFRKLLIESLAGGNFNFKYALLNSTGSQQITLNRATYNTKNLVYFNLLTNQVLDREPAAASWDLLFTQYTTMLPSPYTVAGILQNQQVQAVRVDGVDTAVYANWRANALEDDINTIGYNWKSFTGMGWNLLDSTVYFVKDRNQQMWKLLFTGFGGSASGSYFFTKELLANVTSVNEHTSFFSKLYPNPLGEGPLTVVADLPDMASSILISIRNLQGQLVHEQHAEVMSGLSTYTFHDMQLKPGMYFLTIESAGKTSIQKFIKK
jgi:hypothetical protein